ncbi:Intron-encoded DNA endonuclease aI5 beta [Cyberlindnera fabianii]|uniref:Intron-encoded DNA endonuclease aI5 beta n=1 Tax=Cyberlindnera fabianii TaxID=36022 RepID=A0A1V2KYR1_CYBFA|nr:Intron-encoded DNA endonuclease aI5 beta [Cyberlindnera fabianii]
MLLNKELLGYYLAGLIEGDGYIGTREIIISIHIKDIKNAYYLKKMIGYDYVFYTKEARYAVFKLINGKILGKYKRDQLVKQKYDIEFNTKILPLGKFDLLRFSDANGSFGIDISKSKTHKTSKNIKIHFRIKQKYGDLIYLVKDALGGKISILYKDNIDKRMYQYSSTNFKISKNVINYFDNYPPLHNIYLLIQNKEHLTEKGIDKISIIKENLRD